jgi:hypothetical protein
LLLACSIDKITAKTIFRGCDLQCAKNSAAPTGILAIVLPGKPLSEDPVKKSPVAFMTFQKPVELFFPFCLDTQKFNAYLIQTFIRITRNVIPANLPDSRKRRLIRDKLNGHVQTIFARTGSSGKQVDPFNLQGSCFEAYAGLRNIAALNMQRGETSGHFIDGYDLDSNFYREFKTMKFSLFQSVRHGSLSFIDDHLPGKGFIH